MKIKNYEWNGYGFPVVFDELPAVKIRGELMPDVDFELLAKPVIQYICVAQDVPFSGNQVKFIRHHFKMSLREFARFMAVTHQSVMRWESKGNSAAQIDAHIEFVMRIKTLKALHSDSKEIEKAVDKVNSVDKLRDASYRKIKPLRIPGVDAWGSQFAVERAR